MKKAMMILLAVAGTMSFAYQGQGRGSLKGTTMDLRGNPVSYVELTITLTADPSQTRTVQSNEEGNFTLRSMSEGLYEITAQKENFRSQPVRYNQRGVGSTAVDVLLVPADMNLEDLGVQAAVSGKVIDTQGNPVEGVTITLTTGLFPNFKQEASTDANGEFKSLPVVNWAIMQAYLKKKDYRDSIHQFSMEDKNKTIETLTMQTLDEAYAELGIQNPEASPEDQAIELYNQAVTPYQNKDWEVAEKLVKQALDLNPDLDQALKLAAYANHSAKDWKEAISFGNRFLEKQPNDQNMVQLVMDAATRAKDKETLAKFNKKAEDMGLVDPNSLYNQAVSALNANKDEQAKPILEKILKMDDKYAEAYYHLGMILIREGDFDPALTNLKLFLKHAPKDDPKRQETTDLVVSLSE